MDGETGRVMRRLTSGQFCRVYSDISESRRRVRLTPKGKEPYARVLDTHIRGHITFHVLGKRYKLGELGLAKHIFEN